MEFIIALPKLGAAPFEVMNPIHPFAEGNLPSLTTKQRETIKDLAGNVPVSLIKTSDDFTIYKALTEKGDKMSDDHFWSVFVNVPVGALDDRYLDDYVALRRLYQEVVTDNTPK